MQKMGVLANSPDFPFFAAQEAVIFIRNKEIWEVADQVSLAQAEMRVGGILEGDWFGG